MSDLQVPRNWLGGFADIAKSVKRKLNEYELKKLGKIDSPWNNHMAGASIGDLLLGEGPEFVDDLSYGASPLRGGNRATGGLGTLTLDRRALDVPAMIPTTALAKAPPVAAAGIIRRGGMKGLNSWTEIPEANLDALLRNGGELTSPSVYIAKGGPRYKFGDIAMIARPDALDPVRKPGKIYNRDAWTPTRDHFSNNDVATNRLYNKLEHGGYNDYRHTGQLGDNGHRLLIDQSPEFTSAKAFEESPRGADLLMRSTSSSGLTKRVSDELRRDMSRETILHNARKLDIPIPREDALRRFLTSADGDMDKMDYPGFSTLMYDWNSLRNPTKYQQFVKTVEEGNPFSHRLIDRARTAPSNYAELKVSGPLSLTRENFLAAVPQDTVDPSTINLLRKRGIPVIDTNKTGRSEQDLIDLMDILTEESAYPLEHLMAQPYR